MGACYSKCPTRTNNACEVMPNSSPTASSVPNTTGGSSNVVAPHPSSNDQGPRSSLPQRDQVSKSFEDSSSRKAPPRRLERSYTTTGLPTTRGDEGLKQQHSLSSTISALTLPSPPVQARHESLKPTLRQAGSENILMTGTTGKRRPTRRKHKPVTIGLEVLLRDERARTGYFKYLRAAAHMDKLNTGDSDNEAAIQAQAHAEALAGEEEKSQRSKRGGAKTVDYREDCALFWLEINDLLKIPSSTAAGGVSSFQMGLMDDLFDAYVAKGAVRLLPMVSASERESLAQYLADRNAERALLMFKMLLLDVLDVVTANFDEYVREPGPLGYSHVTKSESMHNVLAQLAKRVAGGGVTSGDRRAHLHHILSTPALCRMFREFLEARNSVENLLFIIDALGFEDLVNTLKHASTTPFLVSHNNHETSTTLTVKGSDIEPPSMESHQDYCVRQAHKIFNKYVRYGSKAEICLGTAVKDRLLERLTEYPLGADIFSDAILLCSAELVQSHLDAFYRTVAYLSYQTEAQKQKKLLKPGGVKQNRVMEVDPKDQTIDSNTPSLPTAVATAVSANAGGTTGGTTKQGPIGLAEILEGVGVHSFRDFLREQGDENTLFFYMEVCEFQRLPHSQRQYIQMRARRIFDKYVRRGGRLELELPVETRRDILWKLSTPTEATFSDAQRLVLRQWETRDLPKFRNSPLYQEMLDQIAASPAAPPPAISHDGEEQAASSTSSAGFIEVSKLSLREFLELEQLRKYFRRFLEREQCANELYFYFEIATFQQFPTSDYLARQARKLFNRFCDSQSREFVPFASTAIHKDLQNSLANPSPAMFNKAQEQIFNFFATTLFPKFQQSEIYRGIRITPQQLRTARLAAMGATSTRKLATTKTPNRNSAQSSTDPGRRSNSVLTPNGEAEDRASESGLTEADVTVTMILENPETRAMFLFFSEEMYVHNHSHISTHTCVPQF
ncbi:Regulator of G-protein signaling 14 [Phytophthora citrophthora]|uniref:Regulator of G-protein signaling 14 n=1 Tax=Phytophthora citrophthora TaxID=4793 RepID=A0AAD9G1M7_9STRA|nr:Regulator of G-protein signaling 14 [Phytophthora citrophthora]